MSGSSIPGLWDLIEGALAIEGATKIHLAVGRPPLVRVPPEGLRPFAEDAPILTYKSIQMMLSAVVDPERWAQIEQVGEGDVRLHGGIGRPITMTLFRNSEAWSAVIHL